MADCPLLRVETMPDRIAVCTILADVVMCDDAERLFAQLATLPGGGIRKILLDCSAVHGYFAIAGIERLETFVERFHGFGGLFILFCSNGASQTRSFIQGHYDGRVPLEIRTLSKNGAIDELRSS